MRTLLAALVVAAALSAATDAAAQGVVGRPSYGARFVVDAPMFGSAMPPASYVAPYSYYAAPYPFPARSYVGFGAYDHFPFHGRPYGYPYDPWTWPYLTSYPNPVLVRYFYPPLG